MLYETPENRIVEAETAKQVEVAFGCVAKKFPEKAAADRLLFKNGSMFAFLEVKGRKTTSFERYRSEGIFVSNLKFCNLRHLSCLMQLPAWMVFPFMERTLWLDIRYLDNSKLEKRGRTDRGGVHDLEWIILAPEHLFKPLPRPGEWVQEPAPKLPSNPEQTLKELKLAEEFQFSFDAPWAI